MSTYISTSKAAVINISKKVATLDNNTADTHVEEELDQEVKSAYENEDLWDEWTGEQEVNQETPVSNTRINRGAQCTPNEDQVRWKSILYVKLYHHQL